MNNKIKYKNKVYKISHNFKATNCQKLIKFINNNNNSNLTIKIKACWTHIYNNNKFNNKSNLTRINNNKISKCKVYNKI